ncbi:MAG: rhodanese-like domain-containing protein [Gammaproteobacteria bacterium]
MLGIKTRLIVFSLFMLQSVYAAEMVEVDVQGLEKLMASGVTVIDVRTPSEWKKTGIVEGSIPIMFFDGMGQPHVQVWMQQSSEYITPDKQVAIICRTGKRSKVVGDFLIKQHGYESVYNVTGGIKAWIAQGNNTVEAK